MSDVIAGLGAVVAITLITLVAHMALETRRLNREAVIESASREARKCCGKICLTARNGYRECMFQCVRYEVCP